MIRYLVRDALGRYMPAYLWVGGFLTLVWLFMAADALAPTGALVFSLCCAWFLGVFAGVSLFTSREVGLMPIRRRTLWRAQWITSILLGTFWTSAAKVVGALGAALFASGAARGQVPDFQFIALSSSLDFLYNGVLLAIVAATGVAAGRVREDSSLINRAIQASGIFVALMGGFAWGFVLRPIIPTTWTEVTGATAMVMGVAFVVSLAAFFYSPPTGEPRPGSMRRDIRRRQHAVRSPKPARLVGIPRLIADDLKSTAMTAASVPAIVSAVFVGMYAFNPSPGPGTGPLKAMKEMGVLPLREDALFGHCYFLLALGLSMINNWRSPGVDAVSTILRQLRVLPLSVRHLHALLVTRRLLGWLVVWFFLLILHVVVFQSAPTTLRLDVLVWLAGADALVYAVLLRWMKWLPTLAFAMIFGMVSSRWIDLQGAEFAAIAGIAVGLACLAAAMWINHHTLTRRNELYRGMALPTFAKPFAIRPTR
jgi:hypothetical protein